MDERGYKENLRKIVLELAQKEVKEYVSQKGIQKYLEGNVDRVIEENIKEELRVKTPYLNVLRKSAEQETMTGVAKTIRSEDYFKSKVELMKLAKYLGLNIHRNSSYNQILRKVASYIFINRQEYNTKYVLYKRNNEEYYLDPEKIKVDLLESYKSKTRNDMRSIAKLLNINTQEEDSAEDIRKKVINHIIKEKMYKNKE